MQSFQIIIEGATGSGKTYKAIHMAQEQGNMIYTAPCRQLVYETAIEYGTPEDAILTGECHREGTGDVYCVYESLTTELIDRYNTIIIDEAHFLTDVDRGGHLYEMIQYAQESHKNVLLVTATRNFRILPGFKLMELSSLFAKKQKKKQITVEEYDALVEIGVPSITFLRYKDDRYMYDYALTADTSAVERLKMQLAFKCGDITHIAATNVLAQGLNFPALNVKIEYNPYDSDELIQQKIGRLGRYGYGTGHEELTYCLTEVPQKIKKNKKIVKKHDQYYFDADMYYDLWIDSVQDKFLAAFKDAPYHENPDSKYGLRRLVVFISSLEDEEKKHLPSEWVSRVNTFLQEEEELKKLILQNQEANK